MPDALPPDLVAELRARADRRQLTDRELARRAGLHPRTVARMWRGDTSLRALVQVARALGMVLVVTELSTAPCDAVRS